MKKRDQAADDLRMLDRKIQHLTELMEVEESVGGEDGVTSTTVCESASGKAILSTTFSSDASSLRLDTVAELTSWWGFGPAGEGYDSGSVFAYASMSNGLVDNDSEVKSISKWNHGVTQASAHAVLPQIGNPTRVYGFARVTVACRISGTKTYVETLNGIAY